MKKLLLILAAVLLFLPSVVLAQDDQSDPGSIMEETVQQESILSYDSRITVNTDATLDVVETIKVYANGEEIKHGIYRDFPTRYKDINGHNFRVNFKLISIKQDNQIQDYHTENLSNGIRIYIGQADVLLDPGIYTYEIAYNVDRELGFFDDHDELYWNVTGNGWGFSIASATAQVILPVGVDKQKINIMGYTGEQGSQEHDYSADITEDSVNFHTTKMLDPYQGLTIVVGWPKGFVAEPTDADKLKYFLRDNRSYLAAIIGLVMILLYYLYFWNKHGRDPKKGTVIPQYEPPQNFSPAGAGIIYRMAYNPKLMAAAVIDMAVKGYLKVTEEKKFLSREYTVEKLTDDNFKLAEEEKELSGKFFNVSKKLKLTNDHHEKILDAINSFKISLSDQFEKKYFNNNLKYFIIGCAMSAVMAALSIILAIIDNGEDALILIFGAVFAIPVLMILSVNIKIWKLIIDGDRNWANILAVIILSVLSWPIVVFIIFSLTLIFEIGVYSIVLILFIILIINLLFYRLIKAPTKIGREAMDQIEGFKWFLSVTEKDRMNFHNPPEKTPELFEKFLPYALALGVENKWAQQFAEVFKQMHDAGNDYHPVWYNGTFSALAVNDFTNSVGNSFSGAISSASVAPGSSSGFSGGGGSGGGGGGGGGGGW